MNDLTLTPKDWKKWKGDTLVVFAFQEDLPRFLNLGKEIPAAVKLAWADGFKAREGQTLLIRPSNETPVERILLVGLGKPSEFTNDVLRKAAARALKFAEAMGLSTLNVRAPHIATPWLDLSLEIQAMAEGLLLGHYKFDRHLTPSKDAIRISDVTVWFDSVDSRVLETLNRARLYSRATAIARDLINEPPSRMNPAVLAAEALKVKAPVTVRVFEKKDLEKMGMGAILGVGSGGEVPPRLVEMIYKPSGKAKKVVALVGKGITFDSGGLSLKPAASMETMKDDMSGAAAVIGVMSVIAELKIPFEVRGYLAIAENMPGGRAQKPGDVVKAFNGKSIEVLNTDAEGRLVLADALSYAGSKKPDVMIDIATLTGACVVALGHLYSAILTNNPELARSLIESGRQTGENFWELPLVKEYKTDVKSKIADLKNIGGRRGEAGTIIGGLFLQEFADAPAWAHLDIAGPSWTDSDQPYCPTGGTGHPVRTLLRYLENS